MMRRFRRTTGALAVAVASLACSGRYYDVGGMDSTPGGGTGGADHTMMVAMQNPGGPSEPTVLGEFGTKCVPSGAPLPVNGAFADPATVFKRVAMLTTGKPTMPPAYLPPATTYAWAGELVTQALAEAQGRLGTAPGVETFLREALAIEPTAPFQVAWGAILPSEEPVLEALLLTPLADPHRVGIFTEPSWLANNMHIPRRGMGILRALFGKFVPPPPPSFQQPELDPSVTERVALQTATQDLVCRSCHQMFEPPGVALSHFDAAGEYRDLENGMPVDAKATIPKNDGLAEIEFDGIADFGAKFANTCEATLGFSDSFLLSALVINQAPEASRYELFEANRLRVQQAFVAGGRTYEALVKAYIQSPVGLGI